MRVGCEYDTALIYSRQKITVSHSQAGTIAVPRNQICTDLVESESRPFESTCSNISHISLEGATVQDTGICVTYSKLKKPTETSCKTLGFTDDCMWCAERRVSLVLDLGHTSAQPSAHSQVTVGSNLGLPNCILANS